MKSNLKFLIFFLIVLVVGCVLYGHTLESSWHFDDYEFIVLNERVHDLTDMKAVWQAGTAPTRFIAFLSFAINYHFSQLDVTSYHVVNILIHLTNTVLVWLLIQTLCRTPHLRSQKIATYKDILSMGVALLFLTHPIQTQAVTYITQRFASLATCFYLMAVLFYLHARLSKAGGRRIALFISAFVATLFGMFTKQITLTLPIMALLLEICFFQDKDSWAGFKKNWRWYYALPLVGLFVIIPSVYGWRVMYFVNVEGISRSHEGDIITMGSYFLTQFRVVPTYIRLLFFPVGQTLDYDFMVSTSVFDPKVLLGALFLGSILWMGIKSFRRNRLLAFGIFWFFLCLSVESTIIPILQVIFEHRCYLPSIGFFLALLAFGAEFLKRRHMMIALSVLILIFCYMTYERNKVWATEISLWEDINQKVPQKQRPYLHLGVAYLMQGRLDEALQKLDTAVQINPQNYKGFHNRAIVYGEMQQFDLALVDFNQAVELNPLSAETWNGRGTVFEKMGKNVDAFKDYTKAIEVSDQHGAAYSNRSNLFIKAKRYPLALRDLKKAQSLGYPIDETRLGALEGLVRSLLK